MVIVVKGELPSLWEMLKSFILVEHEMIVYVAWSLIHEVLFYFMFGFLILNKNLGKIIFGIWLAVILVVNIDNLFLSWFNIFGNYFTSPYNIHFFLGMFSAYLIKRKPLSYGLVLGVLGIIAFLTIGMLEVYTEILEAYNLFFGLSAFIIILGFVSREIKKPMSPPRSLLIMGDSSYSIYLVHSPVISGMAKFAVLAGITANVHVCISFLLTSVVSLAAGIVFYKFVENPLIIMLKRLKIF